MIRWLCLIVLFAGFTVSAQAHEVRPAYLEIREETAGVFNVRFRQPIVAAEGGAMTGLNLSPVFPAACESPDQMKLSRADSYLTQRYQVACGPEVSEITVSIDGLRRSLTDVFTTYVRAGEEPATLVLNARTPEFRLDEKPKPAALGYFMVGVHHLLGGLDHVLFVIGLVLLLPRLIRVVTVATTFTVAHSLTLGLSMLGLVQLPSAPVEAGIALSVLYLAYELTRRKGEAVPLARRRPELVAFGFGLLHGFGFAGALSETGMPAGQVAPALLMFNIGVEAGQLVVIAAIGLTLLAVGSAGANWRQIYERVLTAGLTIGAGYFFSGAFANLVA